MVLGVGTGTIGASGRSDVVGGGVRVVVEVVGSGIGGGATTVSCFELLTTTSAITSPTTSSTATAAATHSHRGDLGCRRAFRRFAGRIRGAVLPGAVLAGAVLGRSR